MQRKIIASYVHKQVKIFLKNGFCFTGIIEEVDDESFSGVDRNGHRMTISNDSILSITSTTNKEDEDG